MTKMATTAAILKTFSCYLPPNVSDRADTWWMASGQHGHLELLKSFRFDIQDGHFEILQTTSAPEPYVGLS